MQCDLLSLVQDEMHVVCDMYEVELWLAHEHHKPPVVAQDPRHKTQSWSSWLPEVGAASTAEVEQPSATACHWDRLDRARVHVLVRRITVVFSQSACWHV